MRHELSVIAVGDIAPGDCTIDGLGVGSLTKKYGCDYPFQNLNDILNNADILLGNLEGPLSKKSFTQGLRLCGLPEMAITLKNLGFDVLSVANNHIFDHGVEIFNETVEYCRDAGIELCGLRGNSGYYSEPVIITKNSLTIGILAYNWVGLEEVNDELSQRVATIRDGVLNYTWNRDRAKDIESREMILDKNKEVFNDISKLRQEVDVLVLMPHWGYEWSNYPAYGVVLEAHSFIDAGVDLIMGSHPHVVQGIERYKKGLIAYSLGNFLFDFSTKKYVSGMILESELISGKLKNYKPRFLSWNDDYQPEEASGSKKEKYIELIARSNKAISSVDSAQKLDDDIIYREYEKKYNNLKLYNVLFLLKKLPANPFLIKPIFSKFITLIELIILRLKGRRVRW